jgi:hypothetical protein
VIVVNDFVADEVFLEIDMKPGQYATMPAKALSRKLTVGLGRGV